MSNQVQTQAAKVWQTITDPSTAATYQKTANVTWVILKETGLLIWLVICLGLVGGEWIWKTGYRTGWNVRGWINSLDKSNTENLLNETGKSFLEVSKSAAAAAIATAKEQLGIESKPEPPLVPSPPRPQPTPTKPEPIKPEPALATKPVAIPAEDVDADEEIDV